MRIICFDGPNGAGKTTQAELLAERIRSEISGAQPFVLSDPGVRAGDPANQIRDAARHGTWNHELTRALLFMAARCELVSELEKLRSDPNAWVILDRYVPSFCVYQFQDFVAACDGDIIDAVESINGLHSLIHAPVPDVTLILSVDPQIGIQRYKAAAHDGVDVFEKDEAAMLNVYAKYEEFVAAGPSFMDNCPVIPVDIGALSEKGAHEQIWDLLQRFFLKPEEA